MFDGNGKIGMSGGLGIRVVRVNATRRQRLADWLAAIIRKLT